MPAISRRQPNHTVGVPVRYYEFSGLWLPKVLEPGESAARGLLSRDREKRRVQCRYEQVNQWFSEISALAVPSRGTPASGFVCRRAPRRYNRGGRQTPTFLPEGSQ